MRDSNPPLVVDSHLSAPANLQTIRNDLLPFVTGGDSRTRTYTILRPRQEHYPLCYIPIIWCGCRESNPNRLFGRQPCYHWHYTRMTWRRGRESNSLRRFCRPPPSVQTPLRNWWTPWDSNPRFLVASQTCYRYTITPIIMRWSRPSDLNRDLAD